MIDAEVVESIELENQLGPVKKAKSSTGLQCWNGRTKGERYLTLAFTTVLCVTVILALVLASFITTTNRRSNSEDEGLDAPKAEALVATPKNANSNVCLTKGCVTAAAAMIKRMDDTADPCENFYEFSCGNFMKKTIIPDEKTSVSMFSLVDDELTEKLRSKFEEEPKPTDSLATKMVKDVYRSCMDTASIEAAGLEPIKDIVKEMGGWPVVVGDSWNETAWSWIQANYINRRLGFSIDYLFDFSVTTDIKNSTLRMIWVDQPSLGLSREYLIKGLNDSDVQAYLEYSINVAKLFGADPVAAEKEMLDVLNFQFAIANISLPREERRNKTRLYNTMSLGEFAQNVPQIPWMEYMNNILINPAIQVDETERIGVSDINYFINLTRILETTPKRTIANYIMWRVSASGLTYLSENGRAVQQEYTKKRTGKASRSPRWKECMDISAGKLAYGTSNLYVKNFFDEQAKGRADTLVKYVRQEFTNILKNLDWMDEVTRVKALEKAASITTHIAYPPELLVDDNLSEYYKGLVVDDKELLANMRRVGIFGTDLSFSKLREPIDKLDWKRHASVAAVNAYYSSIENSIKFPAGILQGVFFEPDRPNYMNFGGIGYVIGHEITHGFDDQGKQFDGVGNLHNWWQKSTEEKFLEKTKCIIEQYGNFTDPDAEMNLNGVNTQGENIADNGGVKEAYKAYQMYVKENGAESTLPGLPYSTNQLFWISAAQIWCSKYRTESLKVRILTGVHSPGRFRVEGPLKNNPDFANDWQCSAGSRMNPAKRCQVW